MEDERRKRAVGPMAFRHGRFAPTLATAVSVLLLSSACQSERLYIRAPDEAGMWRNATSVYDFVLTTNDGIEKSLEDYKGYALMLAQIHADLDNEVDRITWLNRLNNEFNSQGLRILAFPTESIYHNLYNEAIQSGRSIVPISLSRRFNNVKKEINHKYISKSLVLKHNITFDLFETDIVSGDREHPLWKYINRAFLNDSNENQLEVSDFFINRNGEPAEKVSKKLNAWDFFPFIMAIIT